MIIEVMQGSYKILDKENKKDLQVVYPVLKDDSESIPGLMYYPRFASSDFLIRAKADNRENPTDLSADCHDFDFCTATVEFWKMCKRLYVPGPIMPYGHEQVRLVEKIINSIGSSLNGIPGLVVEIGVDEMNIKYGNDHNLLALTNMMLHGRNNTNISYLGIDSRDCSHVEKKAKQAYFLQTDSRANKIVRDKIKDLTDDLSIKEKTKPVSFLLIDGCHSLNNTINDFKYADLVDDNGFIFLHDTNSHPGPSVLFDAIDDSIYYKRKFFENMFNCGCAVIAKKGTDAAKFIEQIDEHDLVGVPRKSDSDLVKSFPYSKKGEYENALKSDEIIGNSVPINT